MGQKKRDLSKRTLLMAMLCMVATRGFCQIASDAGLDAYLANRDITLLDEKTGKKVFIKDLQGGEIPNRLVMADNYSEEANYRAVFVYEFDNKSGEHKLAVVIENKSPDLKDSFEAGRVLKVSGGMSTLASEYATNDFFLDMLKKQLIQLYSNEIHSAHNYMDSRVAASSIINSRYDFINDAIYTARITTVIINLLPPVAVFAHNHFRIPKCFSSISVVAGFIALSTLAQVGVNYHLHTQSKLNEKEREERVRFVKKVNQYRREVFNKWGPSKRKFIKVQLDNQMEAYHMHYRALHEGDSSPVYNSFIVRMRSENDLSKAWFIK